MREFNAAKISRSRQMDIIEKKNLEVPSKELEEENQKHAVEYVSQSFRKSGESESKEPEDDPEEDPEEPEDDPEEDPEEEPEDRLDMESEQDLEEEIEEEVEEVSEVEPEEDPEEYSHNEAEVESDVECTTTSVAEQMIEDPEEDTSEEYVSEPSLENDPKEADQICSNGKKRELVNTASMSPPLQNYHSKKNGRYEEIVKHEVDSKYAAADVHSKSGMPETFVGDESGSGKQENAAISGKQRRSRWDQEREEAKEMVKGNRKGKKRKTRWADDDSRLKFMGPLQQPDLRKDLDVSDLDPKVQRLKKRLSEINSKLERSEVNDDRPEAERSPSPQPQYNNLGIRINTREVRLRQKLNQERKQILLQLIKMNPASETPPKHKNKNKLCKKLYIPVTEYPNYNFVGLILGPKGNTQKRMEKETGAKIRLRGKGSSMKQKDDLSDDEDMHVYITAENRKSLRDAASMVEKLLIPTEEGISDHKRAQLEELAKLKQEKSIIISCSVCKDPGHNYDACPQRKSTLKASCDTCGSFCHPTSGCPLIASVQLSNPLQNSSGLIGSAPNTKGKSNKEIIAAKLYVGYLPQAVNESRLRELFSPFGTITESKVIRNPTTGLSKGYGFVRFDIAADAALAIAHMNGYHMDGQTLVVRVAGVPPAIGFSAVRPPISRLPVYPGPIAAVPGVQKKAVLPQYMLPEAQVSFPNVGGLGLPPSLVYSKHNSQFPQIGPTYISPPVVSRTTESKTTFSSSGSVAQFPGDPDYPGSEFKSYFATRTL